MDLELEQESPNRGSVMYIKVEYYERMVIQDQKDEEIGNKIMHILLEYNMRVPRNRDNK